MVSSWVLKTDCAAWISLEGVGRRSVKLPSAASTVRRRRLLRRTAAALSGMLTTGAPVAGVDHLAVCLREINFPGVGIGHQPAVLKRADNGVGKRIAAGGDHADASSVSENSSFANLPTASSNGPAITGSAVAKSAKLRMAAHESF